MSFRNDHDAALARIEALEHELAEARAAAREQTQSDAQTIAVLERELADLRRIRPAASRTQSPPPARQAPARELGPLGPAHGPPVTAAAIIVATIIAIAIVIAVFLVGMT